MPILSKGGRRNWKTRSVLVIIYALLVTGSVTMIYPFLLMVSGAFANAFDFNDFAVIPRYFYDDDALLKKHLYSKYGRYGFQYFAPTYGISSEYARWENLRAVEDFTDKLYSDARAAYEDQRAAVAMRIADWQEFKEGIPAEERFPYYPDLRTPERYREFLMEKYQGKAREAAFETYEAQTRSEQRQEALDLLNTAHGRAYNTFAEVVPMETFFFQRTWLPYNRPDFGDLLEYKAQLPPTEYAPVSTGCLWRFYLQRAYINAKNLSEEVGVQVEDFAEIPVPVPEGHPLWEVWMQFVSEKYPLRLVRIPASYQPAWSDYLREFYASPEAYSRKTGDQVASFSEAVLPRRAPDQDALRTLWIEFVEKRVDPADMDLNMPETRYREFLKNKYGTIDGLNEAYGATYASVEELDLPVKLADYFTFREHRGEIKRRYLFSNFRRVFGFMATKGRALWVTVVLVGLSIGSALTINPLAAYALSRGSQRVASKVLIFFLATMAFPAEVAMIPGFLLLRDLNLLNTFAALVLPRLANGYSIFLLKGFFDSIPRELYEAAEIDGASELKIFRSITFPMCKPILAVIALNAFKMAYTGFMWAFLTCQDPKMWTIMVWLYDFQDRYSMFPGMVMAALVLASLPTLLVFLFCQKIIMRGIIIPTMK